jgi:hypothetical protein
MIPIERLNMRARLRRQIVDAYFAGGQPVCNFQIRCHAQGLGDGETKA